MYMYIRMLYAILSLSSTQLSCSLTNLEMISLCICKHNALTNCTNLPKAVLDSFHTVVQTPEIYM